MHSDAIFEYRVYTAAPGKMGALQARFQSVTLALFERHGISPLGFWIAAVGDSSELHYLLAWRSWQHRGASWSAFESDPEWVAAKRASEEAGPLMVRARNELWKAAPFLPNRISGSLDQDERD